MNVLRFDVVTAADTASTIFTVPAGKAYTVTGLTICGTGSNSGDLSFKVGDQVLGEFAVTAPDTIYPVSNINFAAGEVFTVTASVAGIFVSASVVERDV